MHSGISVFSTTHTTPVYNTVHLDIKMSKQKPTPNRNVGPAIISFPWMNNEIVIAKNRCIWIVMGFGTQCATLKYKLKGFLGVQPRSETVTRYFPLKESRLFKDWISESNLYTFDILGTSNIFLLRILCAAEHHLLCKPNGSHFAFHPVRSCVLAGALRRWTVHVYDRVLVCSRQELVVCSTLSSSSTFSFQSELGIVGNNITTSHRITSRSRPTSPGISRACIISCCLRIAEFSGPKCFPNVCSFSWCANFVLVHPFGLVQK